TFPRSLIAKGVRLLAERGLPDFLGSEDLPAIGIPDDQVTTAIDVRPWLDRKWSALQAHESQLGPGSLFRHLPENLRAEALGTEWFRRCGAARTLAAPAEREDDLFAGLR